VISKYFPQTLFRERVTSAAFPSMLEIRVDSRSVINLQGLARGFPPVATNNEGTQYDWIRAVGAEHLPSIYSFLTP
jgi:hypothetical protein